MNVVRYFLTASVLFLTSAGAFSQTITAEQIDFCGQVTSNCRATIQMPDGRYLSVPVINGFLPDVREEICDNIVTKRTYSYVTKVQYTGGIQKYGNTSVLRPPVITESRDQWEKFKAPLPVPVPYAPEVKITVTKKPEQIQGPNTGDEYNKGLSELREQVKMLREALDRYQNERSKEPPPKIIQAPPSNEPILRRPSEIKDKK